MGARFVRSIMHALCVLFGSPAAQCSLASKCWKSAWPNSPLHNQNGMGLYPSQTALIILCCVQEREHTDLHSDTSDEERVEKKENEDALPLHARGGVDRNLLPRSVSSCTTLPIVQ